MQALFYRYIPLRGGIRERDGAGQFTVRITNAP